MTQDVNRVIADGLRAARLPEGLAWEPAKQCPQGHPNDDMAVNLTDADYLVPAAEAFCNATQQGYLHFESYRGWNAESTRVWFSRLNRGEEVEGATRGEAEAKAFGSLITRERARLPL